jgi:hypothetical protein
MLATELAMITLFVAPLLAGAPIANSEPSKSMRCRQEIRAIDDQADIDMRDIDQLIDRLQDEVGDRAIASSGQDVQDGLRARLDAAKLRRSGIFDKQHDDLNVVRARCDRLPDKKRPAADLDDAAPSDA